MNANNCVDVLTTAYTYAPFGPWIDAVEAGLASYDANEADACLDALDNAECGQNLIDNLFTGQCFSFQPPIGEDRAAFGRNGAVGDACMTIPDGASGSFFGTCDGTQAWCATVDGERNRILRRHGHMRRCISGWRAVWPAAFGECLRARHSTQLLGLRNRA